MKELASAVNRIAWWIDGEIGQSNNFETLAYMGATDIRYGIFFFAAIKCVYTNSWFLRQPGILFTGMFLS